MKLISLVTLIFSMLFVFEFSVLASINTKKPKKLEEQDFELLKKFKDHEVELKGIVSSDIPGMIFDDKAREKAVGSFSYSTPDASISENFINHFRNNNMFNYAYEPEQKLMKTSFEEQDRQKYEIRKAFARHMYKKVAEYHFNRIIKYHPKMQKVVKTVQNVQNIKVTMTISEPSKPGGKPTKIKFKINPFKTRLRMQYSSELLDGEFDYIVKNGNINFNLNKGTKIGNFSMSYQVGQIKLYKPIADAQLDKTFSIGYSKKVYKEITGNISLSGYNNNKSRPADVSKVLVGMNMPL